MNIAQITNRVDMYDIKVYVLAGECRDAIHRVLPGWQQSETDAMNRVPTTSPPVFTRKDADPLI
jgi:hypothetical protein